MPFIGDQATANAKIKKHVFTATGSQTEFAVASNAGDELQVFLNGVLLKLTDDYTYTTSTVTLGSGATVSDIVEVHVYQSFALVDAVKETGDTMTGELEVPTVKLSSNIIKASDGGSTITLDDSDNVTIAGGLTTTGGITNAGTISAGTFNGVLGDSHTASASYYCQAKLSAGYVLSADEMINTTGTTDPYFTYIGDTTNIIGVNTHDIKLVKAGIYLITFSATFNATGTAEARNIHAFIRGSGTTSEDGTTIAGGYDQIVDLGTTPTSDYGSVTVSAVKSFGANNLINFLIGSASAATMTLSGHSHVSICLIRPT